MKIINPTTFAFVCVLTGVSATRNFTPPQHGSGSGEMEHIKTAANFDAQGVKMEVCPSGDCQTGKYMRLSVTSLTELDASGATVESVDKFKPKYSDWTDIETADVDGVSVSSTTFVSTVEVGIAKTEVAFNLTASIYQGNATVPYGSQMLSVPAGALKFIVDIAGWPFATTNNTLVLAVGLDAKGPNGKALSKPVKKPKNGSDSVGDADVERVDMGDSMFMDVPSLVILDGVEENLLNTSVVESAGDTSFEWVFPSFMTSLHYDPVLGDTSTTTTDSGVNAGDTSGSGSASIGDATVGSGSNGSVNANAGSTIGTTGSSSSKTSSTSSGSNGITTTTPTPAPTTTATTKTSSASSVSLSAFAAGVLLAAVYSLL
ncbi:Multidrug resistance-associated protein 1 [Phytophthora cinnamomi]|uniref:Multidrug resistance-associated protein 1 n=1 Tax=Phytophthora cinnamomi TaxID=4785 RepID=UPI00355A3B9C|nr:Multidrug resistance-associated protein 1 [Phytophthora cinnamomi]KAG6608764.1 Multidrug resistance-associated protein 1 [Phytophthora cinnamomi]